MLMLLVNVGKIVLDLFQGLKRRNGRRGRQQSGDQESDDNNPPSKVMRGSSNEAKLPEQSLELCKTLSDFGYEFSSDGKLVNVKTGSGFVFNVKPDDRTYNQEHYEALGKVVDQEIYNMLETDCGLRRTYIPVETESAEVRGFIFTSPDFLTNENMLILIHGSGVVRAGQWARRLIINNSLESGTQIPYIKRGQEMGFSVVVLNTNQNTVADSQGRELPVKGGETPLAHVLYVWDNYVSGSNAKNIAIVAHSAGGYATVNLAQLRSDQFIERVFAVALTDSVHSGLRKSPASDHLLEVACNWVTSQKPLGTTLSRCYDDINCLSAGTTTHEWTSHCAIESVFDFLPYRLDRWLKRKEPCAKQTESGDFATVSPKKSNDDTRSDRKMTKKRDCQKAGASAESSRKNRSVTTRTWEEPRPEDQIKVPELD